MIIRNIALDLITSRFGATVMQNFEGFAGFFQKHLAGTDNLRVVSIILLLLAFTLFLFLVIILYIKSLLNFIRDERENVVNSLQTGKISENLTKEYDRESALAEEIEKSDQKRAEWMRRQELLKSAQQRRLSAEEELKKNSRKRMIVESVDSLSDRQYADQLKRSSQQNNIRSNFDWSVGGHSELNEQSIGFSFQPTRIKRELYEMSGTIMNMLSRNIEIGKIAQTVKDRCVETVSEEDIIQLIDSIRNFIVLCHHHKFDTLPEADMLPTPEEALYELAHNEPTYCLQLLQVLMDSTIDRAQNAKLSQKRDLGLLEAGNYACIFGTLAGLNNRRMATEAYEMAVEFSDRNPNAWSRVADMYDGNQASKAIWAYQHLLKIADERQNAHQIANAQKHLAQYYYDQGETQQATKLYETSRRYYDALGINQPLTPRESEIVDIIESKQNDDIPDTISRLLQINAHQRDMNLG